VSPLALVATAKASPLPLSRRGREACKPSLGTVRSHPDRERGPLLRLSAWLLPGSTASCCAEDPARAGRGSSHPTAVWIDVAQKGLVCRWKFPEPTLSPGFRVCAYRHTYLTYIYHTYPVLSLHLTLTCIHLCSVLNAPGPRTFFSPFPFSPLQLGKHIGIEKDTYPYSCRCSFRSYLRT
jgi:hypothetical protein